MISLYSGSPEETFALGERLATCLAGGEVICLSGDLGAGKTLFAKGVAAGLGVTEDVSSPTFSILQVYPEGRLPLYHFDLYRLSAAEELDDIGFDETLAEGGVVLIEWAEQFWDRMPADAIWITLAPSEAGGRLLTFNIPPELRDIEEEMRPCPS